MDYIRVLLCLEQVSGKITYNGREMDEFVPERIAAYVSQDDLHSGELTVRETLPSLPNAKASVILTVIT